MVSLGRVQLIGLAALAGVALLYVARQGGVAQAAASAGQAAGAAVVNAAGGVVTGGVSAASEAVGLPTPAQTTTDAHEARWIIDNIGRWEASQWCGAPAFLKALFMEPGSGRRPAPGTDLARFVAQKLGDSGGYTDTGDETARLLARYPAPSGPDSLYSGSW